MPSSPDDLLEHARRKLASANPEDADLRDAIDNAYYSALHRLRQIADRLPDPPTETPNSHERLIQTLTHCPRSSTPFKWIHRRCRKAAALLGSFRSMRVTARYDLDVPMTPSDAEAALKLAEELFEIAAFIDRKCNEARGG